MSAELIDGNAVAGRVRAEVSEGVAELVGQGNRAPGLATVLVGHDPASEVYVRSKRRACVAAGMVDHHHRLPHEASHQQVEDLLSRLAADPDVSGILLQLPLPRHLDAERLIDWIPPEKDVDGLTTTSAGHLAQGRTGMRPCTPSGVVRLLEAYEVPLSGSKVVVIGRSVLVGRPMTQLALAHNATVTHCHSRTQDLAAEAREADVLIVAAGAPGLIGESAIKPGATVIDVGIHRRSDGSLCGDVRFDEARAVAGLLTPVPGGVGPMTIAMLLANTLRAARNQREHPVLSH